MYDDYLASPAASACIERGGAKDIASILADLRRICNHPRLASSSSSSLSGSDGDLLSAAPASFPRVADCTYHRLFESALDYDPFQHVDLNSLNLVCTESYEIISISITFTLHILSKQALYI